MNTYQVTIVVCTRNRPDELRACLKSLIAQKTDFPFEILCVENDSEPKMGEIIAELQEEAERTGVLLRYMTQPVQNIGMTRNCGIENSQSPFVAFIDDDEYFERELQEAGGRTLVFYLTPEHMTGKRVSER